jgi:hypothetical protein
MIAARSAGAISMNFTPTPMAQSRRVGPTNPALRKAVGK